MPRVKKDCIQIAWHFVSTALCRIWTSTGTQTRNERLNHCARINSSISLSICLVFSKFYFEVRCFRLFSNFERALPTSLLLLNWIAIEVKLIFDFSSFQDPHQSRCYDCYYVVLLVTSYFMGQKLESVTIFYWHVNASYHPLVAD